MTPSAVGRWPCIDGVLVLQVFDGHNGAQAAEFARERMLTSIITNNTFPSDIEASLVRGRSSSLNSTSRGTKQPRVR